MVRNVFLALLAPSLAWETRFLCTNSLSAAIGRARASSNGTWQNRRAQFSVKNEPIAILFDRLGPYYWARLHSAAHEQKGFAAKAALVHPTSLFAFLLVQALIHR